MNRPKASSFDVEVLRATHDVPVRLTLDDALRLLRAAGYGDPLGERDLAAVTR